MDSKLKAIVEEAKFYAPFPDALGRATRQFISRTEETPPPRDIHRRSFDRSQNPGRLAAWANSLEDYEDDPELGDAVKEIFAVVDKVLIMN